MESNFVDESDEDYERREYEFQEEETIQEGRTKAKRARRNNEWRFEQTFESRDDALTWIKNEKIWTAGRRYEVGSGTKQLYRCILVPCRGSQCNAELYLLYKADSDDVTAAEHTHVKILANSTKAPHGIKKATKPIVDDLLRLHLSIRTYAEIWLNSERIATRQSRFPQKSSSTTTRELSRKNVS